MVVYTHMNRFSGDGHGTSRVIKGIHVYNDIQIDTCVEIEKGEMNLNRTLNAQDTIRQFVFLQIHTASTPITSGMHTDGGAVIR